MKDLNIAATNNTPDVSMSASGSIKISGKSLPENANKFYLPLIRWIRDLQSEKVSAHVELEYVNSSSTKKLLEIFRSVDKNPLVKEFTVNWFYDVDDEDSYENGKILEELLKKARFRFHQSKTKY